MLLLDIPLCYNYCLQKEKKKKNDKKNLLKNF